MKIIVAYASAGAGHMRAAQAIYNCLKNNYPDFNLELIDILDYSRKGFKLSYIYGYNLMVKYASCLWGFFFYLLSLRLFKYPIACLNYVINKLNCHRFIKFLVSENPDFVISTHFLPSQITACLKRSNKIKSHLITAITDFGVHPFWVSEGVDTYIAASDFTRQDLLAKGVDEGLIRVAGIPIDEKFQLKYDRNAISKEFGLNAGEFTVLIVTGSFGIGPIEEIVDLLSSDTQLLVVCANNKGLFKRLSNKNYSNAWVFGFIDNMQELMAVSDVIITKPGGLGISESLAMELVPLFISAIPGQEAGNIRALEEYGIGKKIKNISEIKEIILDFKGHPEKLGQARNNIRRLKKSFAVREICNVIR